METAEPNLPPLPRYFLTGADQREYGPVTAPQVEQWIAEGRANGQTPARLENGGERKPLALFAEFAAALAAKSMPMSPPPLMGEARADADTVLATALATRPDIQAGSCFSRAWALLMSDFWPIIGYSAVVFVIMAAAAHLYVGIVINGPLLGGLFAYYLKRMRGGRGDWETIFSGFKEPFLPLFLTLLISALLTSLGLVLCILPGIYLAIAWQFAVLLVTDKRLEFWDAMETSRKVADQCWWQLFGLVILSFLINLGGAMVLCIGQFVSVPLTLIALAYAYDDVFNRNTPARH